MAGHSKWANIKRRKEAQDSKKGKAYAQCAREIIMAAKLGGADPAGNFRLRTAIERAKAAGLPNDNIQRAIDKGAGKGESDNSEDMTYEGYGPGGVAIFIEAVTDNRNRTAGDIRSYFNKFNGNLGADGAVAWIFESKGMVQISGDGLDEELAFEKAIEAGASDFQVGEDEYGNPAFMLLTSPEDLNSVCQALSEMGVSVVTAEVTRIPKNTVVVKDPEHAKPLLRLLDAIESHDDVQAVYANYEMDDALVAQVTV